jgi:hypothetical protein
MIVTGAMLHLYQTLLATSRRLNKEVQLHSVMAVYGTTPHPDHPQIQVPNVTSPLERIHRSGLLTFIDTVSWNYHGLRGVKTAIAEVWKKTQQAPAHGPDGGGAAATPLSVRRQKELLDGVATKELRGLAADDKLRGVDAHLQHVVQKLTNALADLHDVEADAYALVEKQQRSDPVGRKSAVRGSVLLAEHIKGSSVLPVQRMRVAVPVILSAIKHIQAMDLTCDGVKDPNLRALRVEDNARERTVLLQQVVRQMYLAVTGLKESAMRAAYGGQVDRPLLWKLPALGILHIFCVRSTATLLNYTGLKAWYLGLQRALMDDLRAPPVQIRCDYVMMYKTYRKFKTAKYKGGDALKLHKFADRFLRGFGTEDRQLLTWAFTFFGAMWMISRNLYHRDDFFSGDDRRSPAERHAFLSNSLSTLAVQAHRCIAAVFGERSKVFTPSMHTALVDCVRLYAASSGRHFAQMVNEENIEQGQLQACTLLRKVSQTAPPKAVPGAPKRQLDAEMIVKQGHSLFADVQLHPLAARAAANKKAKQKQGLKQMQTITQALECAAACDAAFARHQKQLQRRERLEADAPEFKSVFDVVPYDDLTQGDPVTEVPADDQEAREPVGEGDANDDGEGRSGEASGGIPLRPGEDDGSDQSDGEELPEGEQEKPPSDDDRFSEQVLNEFGDGAEADEGAAWDEVAAWESAEDGSTAVERAIVEERADEEQARQQAADEAAELQQREAEEQELLARAEAAAPTGLKTVDASANVVCWLSMGTVAWGALEQPLAKDAGAYVSGIPLKPRQSGVVSEQFFGALANVRPQMCRTELLLGSVTCTRTPVARTQNFAPTEFTVTITTETQDEMYEQLAAVKAKNRLNAPAVGAKPVASIPRGDFGSNRLPRAAPGRPR